MPGRMERGLSWQRKHPHRVYVYLVPRDSRRRRIQRSPGPQQNSRGLRKIVERMPSAHIHSEHKVGRCTFVLMLDIRLDQSSSTDTVVGIICQPRTSSRTLSLGKLRGRAFA